MDRHTHSHEIEKGRAGSIRVVKTRAALGFRVHSGWAAMVVLAEPLAAPALVRRCRIELADPAVAGAIQPYHAAEKMAFADAEKHVRRCAEATADRAQKSLRDVLAEIPACRPKGACILLASGRPLPALAGILASHALIHTAEGEFFRHALREACGRCGVPENGIRERDLQVETLRALGRPAGDLDAALAAWGKAAGPPWRQDEKLSALAAWLALARVSS